MQAELHDLEALLEIQSIDLETMQAKKKRIELPQRIEVMRLRKKRTEIQDKLNQVFELSKRAEAELTTVEDEDRVLHERQERAQEIISTAGSDFRKVELQSKEMAATAQRREALAERRLGINEQIAKIRAVQTQLEDSIAASESEEARLRASFEGQDSELAEKIRQLSARRDELEAGIDPKIMALYDKTAAKTGGVALGTLAEDVCGVCRTHIEGGRLIELKAQAPLGECPNCHRLLVVQ